MAEKYLNPDGSYTIQLPLKKVNAVVAECPYVDRCQLWVEDIERDDVLSIDDADPQDDTKKAIRVGMIVDVCAEKEVHVGMMGGNAPRAVGHHWVEWENFYDPWEFYLTSCERVPSNQETFPQRPQNLTQVRYVTDDGPVSLLHYRFIIAEGDAANEKIMLGVRVIGRGGGFVKTFSGEDNGVISAALSEDFNTIYIVHSSLPPPTYEREASWQKHVWNGSKYTLVAISSLDMRDRGEMETTVDREGLIGGAFETELTTWNIPQQTEGECTDSDGDGVISYHQWARSGNETIGTKEVYSIEQGRYITGTIYIGYSITNGDFAPITASFSHKGDTGHDYTYDFVRTNPGGGGAVYQDYKVEHSWVYNDFSVYDDVKLGFVSIDKLFSGTEYNSTASWDMLNRGNLPESTYWHEGSLVADPYEYEIGYRSMTLLGGWVIMYDKYRDFILDPTSIEYAGYGQVFTTCPPNGNLITVLQGQAPDPLVLDNYRSVHPRVLDPYHFLNAFLVHDQESGNTYSGALIMDDVDDDPYWRVWRNSEDITAEMNQCVNMDPNEFSGIYYP